ncbi:hypothetical protein OAO87_04210 [bacterium]|nr:hypothetical protein [bacterium]
MGSVSTLGDACRCGCRRSLYDSGGFNPGTQRCTGTGSVGNAAAARRVNVTVDAPALNRTLLWAAQARYVAA